MSTERRLERILRAFSEAVSEGEFEKAEGWLAVARFAQSTARRTPRPLRLADQRERPHALATDRSE